MVAKPIERIDCHKDGSIKAKRCAIDGVLTEYWSGSEKTAQKSAPDFEDGKQTGEWTTHDAGGKVVKVTRMPPR